ncbi:MAG: hypothetical protein ABIG63_22575 [Chloroflexota bacterium]
MPSIGLMTYASQTPSNYSNEQVDTLHYRSRELWLGTMGSGYLTPATDVYSLAYVVKVAIRLVHKNAIRHKSRWESRCTQHSWDQE